MKPQELFSSNAIPTFPNDIVGEVSVRLHPAAKITIIAPLAMVAPIGSPAMVSCKPRQARKGATVAVRLCAGVWLVGVISISGTNIASLAFLSLDLLPLALPSLALILITISSSFRTV